MTMIDDNKQIHPIRLMENFDLTESVDFLRVNSLRNLDAQRKNDLGQIFTPSWVSRIMASMLENDFPVIRILDAGAGVGSLLAASVAVLTERTKKPIEIHVTAYEIDSALIGYLNETFRLCELFCKQNNTIFTGEVRQQDFIATSVKRLDRTLFTTTPEESLFNCAILNPPYRKIQAQSETRKLLHSIGIESSNLYTAFLAVALQLLDTRGEIVAITPRSFCNGPYFKHFRKNFLKSMSLHHIHTFNSRKQVFKDSDVLQESIIIHAIKESKQPEKITITSSTESQDDYISVNEIDYTEVVNPNDPEAFIRIITDQSGQQVINIMHQFSSSLSELGLSVSTGRVVDFRTLEHIRFQEELSTVPLLYPTHVQYGSVTWPNGNHKKPNFIVCNEVSQAVLVPNENYVIVKRFSAKEEKKRIVAAIYNASNFPYDYVGFENHLNYFHQNGKGLPINLAKGLAGFLNSTILDIYFRQFNGHTQVNATDLRVVKYPTLDQLNTLGLTIANKLPDQSELDRLVREELLGMQYTHKENQGEDPIQIKQRIEEALQTLKDLGLPRAQQNERSALTLLALLGLKPNDPWSEASNPLCGITPMMEFFKLHYGKNYAPNTRETVRRQTVHQMLAAGLIVPNPDDFNRPVNSPKAVYQIERGALELLRTFKTERWEQNLKVYLTSVETLQQRFAQEREMVRIPVHVSEGEIITLSPGGQNILIEQIIHEFAPRYTPGGKVLYIGDTDNKWIYLDRNRLTSLGVSLDTHGKMPDVIIHHTEKDWLILIEAVTSHGAIDYKRKEELSQLFKNSKSGIVFVTTFLTRSAMIEYLRDISWETEVWIAEAPSHLIHFNGDKFLGPY